jgi:hypothetical protein
MTEQLSIKKFGPISDIKIEIRKVNILIGNQGTGKSTVAKLYTILNDIFFIADFSLFSEKLKDFGLQDYVSKATYIYYISTEFEIEYKAGKFKLLNPKRNFLASLKQLPKIIKKSDDFATDYLLDSFIFKSILQKNKYIPAERVIISTISNSLYSFLRYDINIPKYLLDFGSLYEKSSNDVKEISFDFLNLKFNKEKNRPATIILSNGKKIKLSESASGFQSLIPLLIVLNSTDGFVIEEPELNLFPETQYLLIKYLMNKKLHTNSERKLITTHSPYTLTSLNNLLQAYNTGTKRGNGNKVSKIIPKEYWINPNDVSAYVMNSNGKCESIMDRSEGLIEPDKIDSASSLINFEFDELLRIELGAKK